VIDPGAFADSSCLGAGLAYTSALGHDVFAHRSSIDFVEFMVDHYIDAPGRAEELRRLADSFPVVGHGVDLSIGTAEPLDERLLEQIGEILRGAGALWFGEHLCFTKAAGINLGQLTPLPFSEESIDTVADNVRLVKKHISVPFLLENITYYFTAPGSVISEAEFIRRVLEQADCGLLLDLTNVHTNATNHGYDPYEFLRQIPLERVVEVHLAGGSWMEDTLIDSHGSEVPAPVWDLLRFLVKHAPVRGVVLERDENIPQMDELTAELDRAREILKSHRGRQSSIAAAERGVGR
jgi:uncharacterized protein (UPF0276 family)